ncbi:MAG: lytic transglycosylase domain-containing protein [Treponema sp.]|jgi:soluble lytic murein transglycosylase|nr:lytic transglycosylase domain-containing protein [Treponema sp.]
MGVSRAEAAKRLKDGDVGFILGTDVSRMGELSRLNPSSPFYAGLLVESAGDKPRAGRLFEAALTSPIAKVAAEAARRLVPIVAETKDKDQAERILRVLRKNKNPDAGLAALKGAALYVLGRHDEVTPMFLESGAAANAVKNGAENVVFAEKTAEELASWNRAFRFLSMTAREPPGPVSSPELRTFLFHFPVNAAYRWACEELFRSSVHTLPRAERTAAAGRLAVSRNVYNEGILHFDSLRNTQGALLFRHPLLLNDLGRAYAAAPSKREAGYKLFTEWESAIRTGKNSPVSGGVLGPAEQNAVRYALLFYAGRIRRQQGKHGEAAELFTRALGLAAALPPGEAAVQEDACIWYILSSAFANKPETVPALVKTYAGRWHDDDEFYDILDRLSSRLVAEKNWADLALVFSAIRDGKDDATIARYAYLLGRAVSLGYISGQPLGARDYFTIAYEKGNASFYYRALAASHLGKTVVPVSRNRASVSAPFPHGNELEFFVKFFEFGAASYAMTYLRENAVRYTGRELRTLAGTFAASGRYLESIQITGIYMRREGYVMETADLELYYPKPFTQLIEKHARSNGLHPQVFFGLIRTESAFTPAIASHAGAVGLAQIMPSTAREVAAVIKRRGGPDFAAGGTIDLTNPEINVEMGAVYLKDLTDSLGSPMLALLAYNGGPGRIRRLRRAAPSLPEDLFIETISIAETRNYGKRVMSAAAAYGYLYYGMSMHEVVADIFR